MPGNVFHPAGASGLAKDSVANVTALAIVDRRDLDLHPLGTVPDHLMRQIDDGLRTILALP